MVVSAASEEVILKVFLRLPLEDLLRSRLVCRSWHALIGSPGFLNLWKLSPCRSSTPQQPWICLRAWRKHKSKPLHILTTQACFPSHYSHSITFPFPLHPPNTTSQFHILACSRGLVLGKCCALSSRDTTLHIGNPLLNRWRELPLPFTSVGCHQAVLEVDPVTCTYRIGLSGALPVLVYDSETGSWSNARYYRSGSLRVAGRLRGSLYVENLPGTVICYNMHDRRWSEAEVAGFPDRSHRRLDVMVWSSMFSYQGRHIRASALRKSDNRRVWYEVWELVFLEGWSTKMYWKILSPKFQLDEVPVPLEGGFSFIHAGDLILVHPGPVQPGLKSPPVVTYDIGRGLWHVLEESLEGVVVPDFSTLP